MNHQEHPAPPPPWAAPYLHMEEELRVVRKGFGLFIRFEGEGHHRTVLLHASKIRHQAEEMKPRTSVEDNTRVENGKLWPRIVSSSVGSTVTSLVVTPLEVVKVRLQANSAESVSGGVASSLNSGRKVVPCPRGCGTFVLYNGQMECLLPKSAVSFFDASGRFNNGAKELGTFAMIRRIFATEGVAGIYAGLRPTLVMAVPNTVLYYSTYDEIAWRLRKSSYNASPDWIPLLAGGSARLMASTVTAPFETLRTRQASTVGNNQPAPGMWQELRHIVQTEGTGSLYRGLGSTLWRDVPFSAIYWFCLERMRRTAQLHHNEPLSPMEHVGVTFVSGAISGLVAAACTTPFDVVKTRQQAIKRASEIAPNAGIDHSSCSHDGATVYQTPRRSASTFTHLRHISRTEGIKGLWRGNQTRMLKVAPGCAIMISTYEFGKRTLA
jgi:solute carrier family 25 protein 39/40